MTGADVLAIEATFEGHVQGVGFRAQAQAIAAGFTVTGYVQNLADGRVLMEVEGDANEVEAFFGEVRQQLGDFIRKTELKRSTRPRQHQGFLIRR